MTHKRATGHVQERMLKDGPVFYLKTRVPDRVPEQTTTRLGPKHVGKGRPQAGYYTRRMAEDALQTYLVDARRGAFERAQVPANDVVSFRDAVAEFVRFVRDVRKVDPTTLKDYQGVIGGYLLDGYADEDDHSMFDGFADQPVKGITADDIDAYKEILLAEGRLSNRTIVRHLVVLNGIFKRAKRKGWITENPASADMVERPPVAYTGEFDTYNRDEIELLATHAATAQDAAIYRTAAYTGLRQGELLALTWADIDFLAGLVHVRRNYTARKLKVPKGKKVGSVPMIADVADNLAKLKERGHHTADDDLVFVQHPIVGGYVDNWSLRRRYYKAIQAAGLRKVRFHDLRHAFGSMAIRKLDPHTVQTYMRHAHYSTTQRYLHHKPRPEHARQLEEAFRESNVQPFPGHNRDLQQTSQTPETPANQSAEPNKTEAPTGIEPVYTALQAHNGGSVAL